jgi:cytochrome d ubiquinol oxidase subunit II
VEDEMQLLYSRIFELSSFITPLFLGIIAGSSVSGHIDPNANTFVDAYIYSWLNWFSVAVGLFTVAICGFLAAIYLIGEVADEQEKFRFIQKAKMMNIAAVICGSIVFMAAYAEDIPLADWMFGNAIGISAISAATVSLILLWYFLYKGKTRILRVLAGFQVLMILGAATFRHFPNIIILKGGSYLSLIEHSGQEKAINALGWALLIGSIFILPALFYLIYSFQKNSVRASL